MERVPCPLGRRLRFLDDVSCRRSSHKTRNLNTSSIKQDTTNDNKNTTWYIPRSKLQGSIHGHQCGVRSAKRLAEIKTGYWYPRSTTVPGAMLPGSSVVSRQSALPAVRAAVFMPRVAIEDKQVSNHSVSMIYREEHHKGRSVIPETRTEEGSAKRNIARKHDHDPSR